MLVIDNTFYLNEKEISTKYGISVSWLRRARWIKKSPPYFTLNGKIYYTMENVDKWLKDNLKPN
jgi:hypothetical protein